MMVSLLPAMDVSQFLPKHESDACAIAGATSREKTISNENKNLMLLG